jgi:formylglycine-generating enzyme required for sulfatase activity
MTIRAVAVLIAIIVILWWLSVQSNKETVTEAPPTPVEPQKPSTAPTQEGKEASKEVLQSPQADSKREKQIATQFTLSVEGSQMVVVPGGSFKMGDVQGGGQKNEAPVHTVTIPKSFAIGRHEVTFDDYDHFAKATNRQPPVDRGWGRGRHPVINVSWEDANAYVKWLSEQTDKRYRLPTEAEWEYAARGGKETAYWWGKDLVKGMANCDGCGSQWYGEQTARVGSFKANAFGLYDTAGNVWEWVQDCYHDNYNGAPSNGTAWEPKDSKQCIRRVIRGGSWLDTPNYLRSSSRHTNKPDYVSHSIGFRLVEDNN